MVHGAYWLPVDRIANAERPATLTNQMLRYLGY